MGSQSHRTRSGRVASIEAMEPRIHLAAHPVSPRTSLLGKLGQQLTGAYTQYQAVSERESAASKKATKAVKAAALAALPALTAAAVEQSDSELHVSAGGVELMAYAANASTGRSLAASIKSLGGTGIENYGTEIDAVVPVAELSALSKLKTLTHAEPDLYVVDTGSVTSQGDAAMRANITRSTTGLTGSGVVVGIISDSFNNAASSYGYSDTESTDQASGDLPPGNLVVQESTTPASDEGRAIAQVIYDTAPGATIEFYSATTESGIAAAIAAFEKLGAKVIVNDVTVETAPMLEDGIAAQAAEGAVSEGITYIAAAGNFGTDGYGGNWSSGATLAAGSIPSATGSGGNLVPSFYGGVTYNFAPAGQAASSTDSFNLSGGQTMKMTLEWDQPYYSVTHTVGNQDQVDVYVLQNINGTQTVVGGSANLVTGSGGPYDPYQTFQFTDTAATGTTATYSLMVVSELGTPLPGYIKVIDFSDLSTNWQFAASAPNNGTIFGNANAAGVIAVGSVNYAQTPAYGVSTPVLESTSSVGVTPILFDTAGNRLATPLYRQQPVVDGPDQVATTFFGPVSAGTGLHSFGGTSAAAAGIAGVVALMVQESPTATPATIAAALEATALPIGTTAPNYSAGYGFVRADSATADLVGTVTGTVFSDNNDDGSQESGEPGVAKATVYIDVNDDGVLDAGDLVTTTAANGTFTFNNVPTGSAVVRLVTPGGYIALTSSETVTVTGDMTSPAVNFGVFPTTFNTTAGGVSASVIVDPVTGSKIDITVGTAQYSVTKSLLTSVGFVMTGGNNTLTVSFANGNPTPTGGFTDTTSGANNTLVFNGSSGADSGYINDNQTSFDGATYLTQSNVATEIMNGMGGNDTFYIVNPLTGLQMTFNGGTGNDTLNIDNPLPNNGSSVTFNAGTASTDNNAININQGTYTFPTNPALTSSNLTVNVNTSASAIFAAGAAGSGINQRKIAALNLSAGATATIAAPDVHADRAVLITNTLSLASTSILDVTGNDMIVNNGSWSAINGLAAEAYFFGMFTGDGITSSTAKADTTHFTAVGVATNNVGGQALFSSTSAQGLFDGVAPSLNAVLLKYTYLGDTNLDGVVNGTDFAALDNGYTNHLTGWQNGDIDYDGVVDGTDYSLMDNVFNNNKGPNL